MTKIATKDEIIDLGHYEIGLHYRGDDSEVRGWSAHVDTNHPDYNPVLFFEGTEQECRAYLRELAALTGAYEWLDGGFVSVKRAFEPVGGGDG